MAPWQGRIQVGGGTGAEAPSWICHPLSGGGKSRASSGCLLIKDNVARNQFYVTDATA